MMRKIMDVLRASLMRGALFLAPIWLSIFLVGMGYNFIESSLGDISAQVVRWIVPARWLPASFADGNIPGLSLFAVFVVLALVGSIASWQFGRRGLKLFDRLFLSIPLVNSIYSSARKVIDAFGDANQNRFQKAVFVDWPGDGIKVLAFVTGELTHLNGKKLYTLYIPGMPNPTSGFVVIMPADKVVETEMTKEEAFKFGMSLGVLVPHNLPVERF
jgi:uncharacterized membrane protein